MHVFSGESYLSVSVCACVQWGVILKCECMCTCVQWGIILKYECMCTCGQAASTSVSVMCGGMCVQR